MKELIVPPAAQRDRASVEVLRVWIAEQGQHVTLLTGIWEDPAAWGVLLADLARHVVNAYEQEHGLAGQEVLASIRAYFVAELDSPTDVPKGTIISN